MKRSLDFAFPAILLGVTLMRLVLNVASTRLILSADASTPGEAMLVAGRVIESFGTFVVGSSIVVGLIIFIILVVVQFVVITKGATRMSEVAARFTLDAMPGKQMAIDADLSAGLIDEREARRRRDAVTEEADFYGAMDGASKFVRGDAIAGIIITVVNIIGGIAIGLFMKNWDFRRLSRSLRRSRSVMVWPARFRPSSSRSLLASSSHGPAIPRPSATRFHVSWPRSQERCIWSRRFSAYWR